MISDFHCSDAKLLDRRTKYKHRRQRPRKKNEATSMKKKDWGKIMTQASFMVKFSSYLRIWVF